MRIALPLILCVLALSTGSCQDPLGLADPDVEGIVATASHGDNSSRLTVISTVGDDTVSVHILQGVDIYISESDATPLVEADRRSIEAGMAVRLWHYPPVNLNGSVEAKRVEARPPED